MKIKLNQGSAGPNGYLPPGTIITVDKETGEYMIDSRQGVEVKDSFPGEPVPKKAEIKTFETAVAPDTPETSNWRPRRGRPPKVENQDN